MRAMPRAIGLLASLLLVAPVAGYTRLGQIVRDVEKLKSSDEPFAERLSRVEVIVRHFIDHINAVDRMVNDHSETFATSLIETVQTLDKDADELDKQFERLNQAMRGRLDHMERMLGRKVERGHKSATSSMWDAQPQLKEQAYAFRTPFFGLLFLLVAGAVLLYFYHLHLLAQDKKFLQDEHNHMTRNTSGSFL